MVVKVMSRPPRLPRSASNAFAKRKVTATRTHLEGELAGLQLPLLGNDIPNAQVATRQFESNLVALARLEVHLLEATKLP
jgi:hypothetical protein